MNNSVATKISHWLSRFGAQVDDCEPAMSQQNCFIVGEPKSITVGTTMRNRCSHFFYVLRLIFRKSLYDARNATHELKVWIEIPNSKRDQKLMESFASTSSHAITRSAPFAVG